MPNNLTKAKLDHLRRRLFIIDVSTPDGGVTVWFKIQNIQLFGNDKDFANVTIYLNAADGDRELRLPQDNEVYSRILKTMRKSVVPIRLIKRILWYYNLRNVMMEIRGITILSHKDLEKKYANHRRTPC